MALDLETLLEGELFDELHSRGQLASSAHCLIFLA
jgi:hypothetical protein